MEVEDLKHWQLLVFTICVQAAIGIMLFAGTNHLCQDSASDKNAIAIAGALAIIGIVASFLHLGRPLRAMGAIVNLKTSWLSREILLTAVFTGLTVIIVLTLLIGYLFFKYWTSLKAKSVLLLPYLIWLLIATSLNGYIYIYN